MPMNEEREWRGAAAPAFPGTRGDRHDRRGAPFGSCARGEGRRNEIPLLRAAAAPFPARTLPKEFGSDRTGGSNG